MNYMYIGDDGNAAPFRGSKEMVDVIKRDGKDEQDSEIKALWELIRNVREQLVKACNCDEVREDPMNSEVCGNCILVGMIDEGWSAIGFAEPGCGHSGGGKDGR